VRICLRHLSDGSNFARAGATHSVVNPMERTVGKGHNVQDRRLTSRSRDTKSQMVSSSNAQSSVQLSSHPCVRHWKQ